MPQVSHRGTKMPESPIRKLVPFADGAKKRGVKVYHLNIGQPDVETPDVFWDNLHNIDRKVLEYCPSDGYDFYKEKFAGYYNSLGINVAPENFIVTTGASEALFFGMFACLDAEDEVIIPEPMYANYIGFSQAGNIKVDPITTSIDNNFALPSIDEFEAKINANPKIKAILICNPNNPTGYLYSVEELQRLKEIAQKHDLFLFVDEVYREFAYGGKKQTSILTFDGLDENVVVFDSVSKRFSACGARVGALISRNKEVIKAAMKFAQARLSPPSLSQIAGAQMFDLGESFYSTVREEYDGRRKLLLEELSKIDGVVCPNPGGAFYAMVQLPVDDTDKFCRWMLEEFSYENSTVMMAPGSGFYSTPGAGKQEVRIAYVLNQDDLKKAMECLEQGLVKYNAEVPKAATV